MLLWCKPRLIPIKGNLTGQKYLHSYCFFFSNLTKNLPSGIWRTGKKLKSKVPGYMAATEFNLLRLLQ